MKTIGLIGAGHIGSQIARLAVAHGYSVVISNSRGPETRARRHPPRPARPETSSS
jgi:predicted dinucleotide-binding enzyme